MEVSVLSRDSCHVQFLPSGEVSLRFIARNGGPSIIGSPGRLFPAPRTYPCARWLPYGLICTELPLGHLADFSNVWAVAPWPRPEWGNEYSAVYHSSSGMCPYGPGDQEGCLLS